MSNEPIRFHRGGRILACLQRPVPWLIRLTILVLAAVALAPANAGLSSAIDDEPIRFAVIGDGGTGKKEQMAIAQQMVAYHDRHAYQFVLMVGDNIYPHGSPKDYHKKFEVPYASLLERGVKFYAVLGNHDVRFGRWKDAIEYPGFNMNGQRYYTITKGNGLAQFFALDTTLLSDGKQHVEQLDWLERELRASSAVWKIAFFHHPIYSSGKRHGSDVKMRAILEPLLINGGIRVVFSGHDHFYERVAPQHDIDYFVTGAAGQLRRGNIRWQSGITLKGNDQVRHFMYIELDRQEMRFEAVSETGAIIDSGSVPVSSVEKSFMGSRPTTQNGNKTAEIAEIAEIDLFSASFAPSAVTHKGEFV